MIVLLELLGLRLLPSRGVTTAARHGLFAIGGIARHRLRLDYSITRVTHSRVDIADTVLLVNPGRWAAGAAEAPAATALLAPTALGVRRFERAPLADSAELDPSAIALQLACDASTLALPQPPADGSADAWTARAAVELADGDGATMLRQGVARSEALDLRRRLLDETCA